jgi:hypothetical protein
MIGVYSENQGENKQNVMPFNVHEGATFGEVNNANVKQAETFLMPYYTVT